jgi:hypothetical protein
MDFLCPNCQKMLTVPDQYSGTLMKCPLCQSTFQAPALPAQPAPLAAAPAAVPAASGGAEVYGLKDPPPPAPPAPPVPPLSAVSASTGSAPPALNRAPAPSGPPVPPLPPSTDYKHSYPIYLKPTILAWIAPACLVLIFLFQIFFSWVGYYWGGHAVLSQGAYSIAFGHSGPEKAWQALSGIDTKMAEPTWSPAMLLYIFLSFITMVLAVISAVATLRPDLTLQLPPAVRQLLPYRWAIVGGLCVLLFLLLSGTLVLGFPAEINAHKAVVEKVTQDKDNARTDEEEALRIGKEYNALGVQRTLVLRLVFILQLVAIAGAALAFWVEYRGAQRPLPQLALRF